MRRQRPADPALEQARQAQRRPTLPSQKKSDRVQDTYAVYDDFPWEKIEEFLKTKWPRWDFKPSRFNDKWVFEVPEKLTEGDRRELRNRRDAPKRTQRPSVSPEPE
ncbi:uncharacterized protein ALTATR162_LOCUS11861 [Alternaria atra]|uniref:Uncharacterized protein n=1 Tax=Alternaria atra TaxID=119953 RepID=A0A8J2IDK6_9PLEO|nr:uncharacterized protein ALTATR162_LOCUS11861 [Alternaria atra]CAG5188073.1 unnamed protein product [Alternaria atra]